MVAEMLLFFVYKKCLLVCFWFFIFNLSFRIFREPAQRKTGESGDRRRISQWLLTQLSLVLDESQSALCSRGRVRE
jgi:hypothetical protein